MEKFRFESNDSFLKFLWNIYILKLKLDKIFLFYYYYFFLLEF